MSTPLTPQEANLLVLLGAQRARGGAPLELTEGKSGPPVTLDELFELHDALAAMCCPQSELIARAKLTELLEEHILIAGDIITAAKEGNDRAVTKTSKAWCRNGNEIRGLPGRRRRRLLPCPGITPRSSRVG